MLRVVSAFAALVAVLSALGCGGNDGSGETSGELVNLATVQPVADAFNADEGTPRLVLLLSPT